MHNDLDEEINALFEMPEPEPKFSYDAMLDWELLANRTILLHGEITEDLCYGTARELIALSKRSKEPIYIILNSIGGSVMDGLLIVETIDDIVRQGIEVNIEVRGIALSMGLDILLSGSHRSAGQWSSFLLHEMSETFGDEKLSLAKDRMKHADKMDKMLAERVANRTKMEISKVKYHMERKDFFFFADQALELGFIDEINGK